MIRAKLGVLAVICVVLLAPVAAAGDRCVTAWGSYGSYWGAGPYGWWCPSSYQQERIPHFALYPPVYYSYPVSRPYGHSPFAYSPRIQTAEAAPSGPLTLSNPYLSGNAATRAKPEPQSRGVPRIANPYVVQGAVQGEKTGVTREADQSRARLVIMPAPAVPHP